MLQDPTNGLRVEEGYGGLRVDDILDAEKDVEVIFGRLIWLYIGKLTPGAFDLLIGLRLVCASRNETFISTVVLRCRKVA